tara:strand:- start:330 stop:623 length:294 start_codon:yes stop_codon:yes gene_type:complete
MDIDKLIEEKTECFTGNGDYYFTYVTPEDCKKIIEEVLKQGQSLPIDSVSYCVEQTKNVLTNKFCNIAKEHVGETFDKVPEATDILKAIDVIEKHCS